MEDQNKTQAFDKLRKTVNIRRKYRKNNEGTGSYLRPLFTALSALVILCLIVYLIV